MKKIELSEYNITFGNVDVLLSDFLKDRQYSKIGILVDEHTRQHCLSKLSTMLTTDVFEISSGEQHKTIDTCGVIWEYMQAAGFDRHSLLINLGGGVIGDMGGYAASCYMRGIDFVQIPTSLLSQVDASVGGKLAVDFKGYKNLIGIFKNPKEVIIDDNFLYTLPPSELRSGFAEMLKHGLIQNADIWQQLSTTDWKDHDWLDDIKASVQIKADVVTEDPFEKGLRKTLNYGHTVGHAVETLALDTDRPLLHGEAIGIGMMVEAVLSNMITGLSVDQMHEVIDRLQGIYDDIDYNILDRAQHIIKVMGSDKKNKDGNIRCALLENIGRCTFDHIVTPEQITFALRQTLQLLNQ